MLATILLTITPPPKDLSQTLLLDIPGAHPVKERLRCLFERKPLCMWLCVYVSLHNLFDE